MGYLGIKSILDGNGINYNRPTLVQASDLKERLEQLNLRRNDVTVVSIDAVDMYPSIKYKLIKKAVDFFAKDLDDSSKQTINHCLEMVKFGMGNTLITFTDKYYEYGGEMNAEDRGLMIGGYELAWFADLVVAYIFENTTDLFQDTLYNGLSIEMMASESSKDNG